MFGRLCLAATLIPVALTTLVACAGGVPDRHANADLLTAEVHRMPGVIAASNDTADSQAQGMVHFWLRAQVSDSVTEEQLAAITRRYLQAIGSGTYTGYRVELEMRRGPNVFRVDSGELPIVNRDQVIAQARSWMALQHAFAGSTITLRATIVHPDGQKPVRDEGHSNRATLELPDSTDYRAVSAAVQKLADTFPDLTGLTWTIDAGRQHPAEITTSRRLPNPGEIDVWNRLNADQSIPHIDKVVINAPMTPPVWISEKTTSSHDVAVALQLARRHLPVVATLAPPVLYTATDQLSGHIGARGFSRGPVAVTVGGCTPHDPAVYTPIPAERELMHTYERCPS